MSKVQGWIIIVLLYLIMVATVISMILLIEIVRRLSVPLPVHLIPSSHASP